MNLQSSQQPQISAKTEEQNGIVCELHTDVDWLSAAKVLRILRPNLDPDSFVADRARLSAEGYRLIGVRANGEVVSIASYIIAPHPIYFRELQIHDMATLEEYQSKGFGSKLLIEIDRIAREQKCGRCIVQSRIERNSAHEFYRRNGYEDYTVGFIKKIA